MSHDDTPELPESVRALAGRVREGGLSEATRSLIAHNLDGGGGGGTPSAAPRSGASWTLAAVGGLAAAAALFTLVLSRTDPEPEPRSVPTAQRSVRTAEPRPSVPAIPPAHPVVSLSHPMPPPSPSPPRTVKRVVRVSSPGRSDEPDPVDEAALLLRARRVLSSDPEEALELCAQHAAAFPHGQLAPEREVLRIDSLRATGRHPQARAAAERFLAQHPESPHRTHLDWAHDAPQ